MGRKPRVQHLTILALVWLAGACAGRANVPSIGPAVQYTLRSDTSASPFSNPADDAARVLGLPTLRHAILPPDTRELRTGGSYPMIAGTPAVVLRLVQQSGRPAFGQVIFVWTQRRDWPGYPASRCSPWANSFRTCVRVPPADSIDWEAAAKRLDELGAWTLSARCETDGVRHMDGPGDLSLSRLIGARFEAYECDALVLRQSTAAGRAALAISEYIAVLVTRAETRPER